MCKTVTVLITYNPDLNSLAKSLNKLIQQTDYVLICNNSKNALPEKLSIEGRIEVINFGKNLGIAAAQSIGMSAAFGRLQADYVLQMDQDSLPEDDMVLQLFRSYKEFESSTFRVGLVGVLDYDSISGKINGSRLNLGSDIPNSRCKLMPHTLSSGSLITKAAYDKVGGMDDSLFIDGVDSEFCWRLIKNGFSIILNPDAKIGHRSGDGKKRILGLLSVGVPSPSRHYYAIRNTFILCRRNYVPISWKFRNLAGVIFKIIFYPLCLPHGKKRFKFIFRGVIDGLKNKRGCYRDE